MLGVGTGGSRKHSQLPSNWASQFEASRDDWTRTSDLSVPNAARYHLRYIPWCVFTRIAPGRTSSLYVIFEVEITPELGGEGTISTPKLSS